VGTGAGAAATGADVGETAARIRKELARASDRRGRRGFHPGGGFHPGVSLMLDLLPGVPHDGALMTWY